jgi:hypothetical protein
MADADPDEEEPSRADPERPLRAGGPGRDDARDLRETTTLGVRFGSWKRSCLQREWLEVETEFGPVRVKVARQDGELRTAMPEYDDCRRVAAEKASR